MTPVVTVEECVDVIRIDGARVDIVTDGTGVIGHDCMLSVVSTAIIATSQASTRLCQYGCPVSRV